MSAKAKFDTYDGLSVCGKCVHRKNGTCHAATPATDSKGNATWPKVAEDEASCGSYRTAPQYTPRPAPGLHSME